MNQIVGDSELAALQREHMIDQFLNEIEEVRADGAVVLLKWDGERKSKCCTVVITKFEADYVWRQDSDDLESSLRTALADYKASQRS
ncbi:hypothetical protein ABT364_05685 [Massilia sp. SR12]